MLFRSEGFADKAADGGERGLDCSEPYLAWISTETLLDRLHQLPIDFSVESPSLMISEVLEQDDGPPYVFLLRDVVACVVLEMVMVEGDVWVRQLAFKPRSLLDLEAFLQKRAQLMPSPWCAA